MRLDDALATAVAAKAALPEEAPAHLHAEASLLIAGIGHDRGDLRALKEALAELTDASRRLLAAGDALAAAALLNDQGLRWIVEDLSDALAYQGGIERWIVDPQLLTPATLRQPGAVDVLRAVVARTLPAVADRWLALARANPEGQAGLFGPGPDPIDELAQIVRSVTSST